MARSLEDKVEILEDSMVALAASAQARQQTIDMVLLPAVQATSERLDDGDEHLASIGRDLAQKADAREVTDLAMSLATKANADALTDLTNELGQAKAFAKGAAWVLGGIMALLALAVSVLALRST